MYGFIDFGKIVVICDKYVELVICFFFCLIFDFFININFFGIIVYVVGKFVYKFLCLVYDVIFNKFEFFLLVIKDCFIIENFFL